ncbi:Elongin-B [Holothuria leucospilota]|uniref:Elongin-B n=1 Tax=Holothuria leucospilota TaxID=206669 RepID=A0A9Q1CE04_HOLLE|nr:Elongin-B [Holothuria leucospilota]
MFPKDGKSFLNFISGHSEPFCCYLLFLLLSSQEWQDVFLMIQREKTTIFTDAKESNTVYDLKKIIEGITKKPPEDQRLFKDGEVLEDTKTLADSGLTSNKAKAQDPAPLGLTFRKEGILKSLRSRILYHIQIRQSYQML